MSKSEHLRLAALTSSQFLQLPLMQPHLWYPFVPLVQGKDGKRHYVTDFYSLSSSFCFCVISASNNMQVLRHNLHRHNALSFSVAAVTKKGFSAKTVSYQAVMSFSSNLLSICCQLNYW